jgi:hypothetical protein
MKIGHGFARMITDHGGTAATGSRRDLRLGRATELSEAVLLQIFMKGNNPVEGVQL